MSERTELQALVESTFLEMQGVGTMEELRAHVLAILPGELRAWGADRGVRQVVTTACGDFFRSRNANGLPMAPEVDEHGTHMLLELTDPGQYRYAIKKCMARAGANRKVAARLADQCLERHGVWIDIDHPDAEAVAS